MSDITSANSIVSIFAPQVFSAPVTLAGFSADDIFDTEALEAAEISMGVDGLLSAGFVFVPLEQTIALQADSPSQSFFDALYQYEVTTVSKTILSAVFKFPALGIKFNLAKGFLRTYKMMPDARRILQPRRHRIAWERPVLAPIVGV